MWEGEEEEPEVSEEEWDQSLRINVFFLEIARNEYFPPEPPFSSIRDAVEVAYGGSELLLSSLRG